MHKCFRTYTSTYILTQRYIHTLRLCPPRCHDFVTGKLRLLKCSSTSDIRVLVLVHLMVDRCIPKNTWAGRNRLQPCRGDSENMNILKTRSMTTLDAVSTKISCPTCKLLPLTHTKSICSSDTLSPHISSSRKRVTTAEKSKVFPFQVFPETPTAKSKARCKVQLNCCYPVASRNTQAKGEASVFTPVPPKSKAPRLK